MLGRFLLVSALLYDWSVRWAYREMFFTVDGAMPPALNPLRGDAWNWSLFNLGESRFMLDALMLLGPLAFLGLLFQPSRRCWPLLAMLFEVSVAYRDVFCAYSCYIYAVLLLWLVLQPEPHAGTALEQGGYAFQLGIIYTSSALFRMVPHSEWLDGSAMRIVADYGNLTTPAARHLLLSLPDAALRLLTWLALALEVSMLPLLLWRRTRRLAILLGVTFHLLTFLGMTLAELPWFMTGALLLAWCGPAARQAGEAARWSHWSKVVRQAIVVMLLALSLADWWNQMGRITPAAWGWKTRALEIDGLPNVCGLLGMRQNWTMFSSPLPRYVLWPVALVKTSQGREFNLLTGTRVDWTVPQPLCDYMDHRVFKYYAAVYACSTAQRPEWAASTAQYLQRDWNQRFPNDPLASISLWYGWAPNGDIKPGGWLKVF